MKNLYKINSFLIGISLLLLNNCSSDPSSPNDTDPPTPPGYKMEKYFLETELPSYVNILFQVSNMSDKGVSNLTVSNFELFEDEQPVSPTESQMEIVNKQNIYKLKTVICLDNSSSVGSNLAQIKSAALTMINSIVPEQEVAVYVFSETPILLKDFTNNKNDLINAINSIDLGFATTNLYGSIIECVSRWQDSYRLDEITQGFLVILTDGRDTQGSSTLEQALNARGNKKVYTIGLGSEIDPNILQQLGNAGSYSINDINQLSQLFGNIQADIELFSNSFYWLRYLSPTRGNNNHQLTLKIKNNQNTSSNSFITGSFNSSNFTSYYLNITNPVEGVVWPAGSTQIISWDSYNVSQIKIELSTDDGISWTDIALVSGVELYSWTIPTQKSTIAKIKISDASQPNLISYNEGNFLIKDPNWNLEFVTVVSGPYTYGINNESRNIDYDYEIMKYEVTRIDYLIYLYEALHQGLINIVNGQAKSYYEGDNQYPPGEYKLLNEIDIYVDNNSFRIVAPEFENHPVNAVTWFGAKLFAEYYDYKLPTEEEWEKAARGNTGWTFPWGNLIDGSRANYKDSGDPFDNGTTPIGYYNGDNGTLDSPSPYGIYDLAGNVWEWTISVTSNNQMAREVCGGCWGNPVEDLKSYNRLSINATDGFNGTGLRCVKK